jgi:hypothetical protein
LGGGLLLAACVAAEGRTPWGFGRADAARLAFADGLARARGAFLAAGLAAALGFVLALVSSARPLARRRLGRWGRVRGRDDMTSPPLPEPVPVPASGFSGLIAVT